MSTETAATTWDALYRSDRPQRYWPSEDVIRFCARRLTPGMRVLEVGCGNGANLWYLAAAGYFVFGIDRSVSALALAQIIAESHGFQTSGPELILFMGAMGQLRTTPHFKDLCGEYPIDAIIDCRASQHTPWSQHAAIYREYYELLKPGGWLFLLHLDDATVDAKVNEHLRMPGPVLKSLGGGVGDVWTAEPYTWSDIERGVYPRNGVCCMPPADALRRLMESVGLAVDRLELLRREADDLVCQYVAIDARRPL